MTISANTKLRAKRMMNPALLTAAMLFCAYWFGFPSYAGQVIDEETGKPLEGVIAMAHWTSGGPSIVISRSNCYAFVTTKTDKNGKFSVALFSWNFNPLNWARSMGMEFYLAGYETSPNDVPDSEVRKLRKYKGAVKQRLEDFTRTLYREQCLYQSEYKEKLGPLYEAQYGEAKQIAVTPDELNSVRGIKLRWKAAILPFDAEHRNIDGTLNEKYQIEVLTK